MEAGIRIIGLQDSPDFLQLLGLQMAAYVKEAEMIGLPDIPPLFESPDTIRSSGEAFYGYYTDDSELAGAVSVRHEAGGLRICRLMVLPERFRQGIASRLLQFVLEELTGGSGAVIVRTVTGNTSAWSLYTRFGFKPSGEVSEINGLTLAELYLIRSNAD
jgi:ribosomal protein S18 acetylase RimI-like enzyme